MNTYRTSSGEKIPKSIIDRRVYNAKKLKLEIQREEHGYNFCEECKQNDCKPIDCSHIISVDECQKTGQSEKAWDLNNIRILGRDCHKKYDKLNLKFKTIENV